MMKTAEITEWIANQKKSGKRVFSNCYLQFARHPEKEWDAAASEDSLVIRNKDHGVNWILFYTADFDDMGVVMQKELLTEEEYVIDILSKDALLYEKELKKIGFSPFTRMMRMSNPDITSVLADHALKKAYDQPDMGKTAKEDEAAEINQKLWEIFDSRVSHLQTTDELRESIRRGEVVIHRTDQGIVSILQKIVEPKCFYINQVYNGTKKRAVHAILLHELNKYAQNGGKYVFAWVEESNVASRRFHEKFGLKHDGLWNSIYTYGVRTR